MRELTTLLYNNIIRESEVQDWKCDHVDESSRSLSTTIFYPLQSYRWTWFHSVLSSCFFPIGFSATCLRISDVMTDAHPSFERLGLPSSSQHEALIDSIAQHGQTLSPSVVKAMKLVDRSFFLPRHVRSSSFMDKTIDIGEGVEILGSSSLCIPPASVCFLNL